MSTKHNFLASLIFICFLVLSSNNLLADNLVEEELIGIYGSEEFISIATGYKQTVSAAPAVASVISAADIKEMGASDIDDVLESIPGLHVSRSTQSYFPIYTFRGIYSNFNPQVLLLIDGIPQTNLFTGGKNFVWGGMPVEAIDRIEIMRGPGSAIYGADAFAGVISIITKDGQNGLNGSDLGVKYGSFDSKSLFGHYQHRWGNSSLYAALQYYTTDGQREIIDADQQSYLDEIVGTDASLAPGAVSLPRENVDLNIAYTISNLEVKAGYQGRRDMGLGAGISQALDASGRYKSDRFQLGFDLSFPELQNGLDLNISGSYLDVSQENDQDAYLFPPGSTGPFLGEGGEPNLDVFEHGVIGNPEVFERHTRLNATLHYSELSDHDLTLGVGYYYGDLYKVREKKNYCTDLESCNFIREQLESDRLADVTDTKFVFLREGDRENQYFYLQDVYSISNDWQLTAGIRYDNYSDFGETINPRLALVWSTSNDLTTKFLYGEAFRAPAFAETRAINNTSALGNPDLEPETLKSYELVFDYEVNYSLDFVFNTFYYEWDDIILFVPDASGGTSTAQNFGRQTGYGAEFETRWSPSRTVEVLANYAWQKSTNTRLDVASANAPENQFYVRLDWEVATDTYLNLQSNWVMGRNREISDPRSDIDDYVIFDLTLRRKNIWRNLEAAVIVRNLFDEDAREPSPNGFPVPAIPNDLPLAGRSITGEIRVRF